MKELYFSMLDCLRGYIRAVCGRDTKETDFRLATAHPLSCRAFIGGEAARAACELHKNRADCQFFGVQLLSAATEAGGWLLFDFTDEFYIRLCEELDCLPHTEISADEIDEEMAYLINRLYMLARQGKKPCPKDVSVQRALWEAFYEAVKTSRLQTKTRRSLLRLSRHLSGKQRVELEHNLGGAAAALLNIILYLE